MTVSVRLLAAVAAAVLAASAAVPVATAADPSPASRSATVAGHTFQTTGLQARPARVTTVPGLRAATASFRKQASATHVRAAATHPAAARKVATSTAPRGQAASPATSAATVTDGMALWTDGYDFGPTDAQPQMAVSASDVVTVSYEWLRTHPRDESVSSQAFVSPDDFFGSAANEATLSPTIAWDVLHGRWVAAASSWQYDSTSCTSGVLDLAVSTTGDPTGAWTRWRIPLGAHVADSISLGLSDSLIGISGNEYPIDPDWVGCLGLPFSGAGARVVDWADVLDGGALTVRDVTPASPTHYWSYRMARNTPDVGDDHAGDDLHLVVDAYRTATKRWGDVDYGVITGGAVSGTAALTLTNLTLDAAVPALDGPPWMTTRPGYLIEGYLGNGSGIDEGFQSVAWRLGRLEASSITTCRPSGDTSDHACIRVLTLDDAGTPTLAGDRTFGTSNSDEFFGIVGMARDGTSLLAFNQGESVFATWRNPGETFATDRPISYLPVRGGTLTTTWSSQGVAAADPTIHNGVWAAVAQSAYLNYYTSPIVNELWLRGGLTGDPGGTVTGPAFTTASFQMHVSAATDSPIAGLMISTYGGGSPDPYGVVTFNNFTWYAVSPTVTYQFSVPWETSMPETLYYQFMTSDGHHSPIAQIDTYVDQNGPSLSVAPGFTVPATLGSRPSMTFTWASADSGAGLAGFLVSSSCTAYPYVPTSAFSGKALVTIGVKYCYWVQAADLVGNSVMVEKTGTAKLFQNTSTSIKYGGTWSAVSASGASGGSVKSSSRAGATATFATGAHAYAIVATKGPKMGAFEVWVNGVKVATVDLRRSSTAYRQVVWQGTRAASGTSTIKIKVLGTAGRPRVDLDAFISG